MPDQQIDWRKEWGGMPEYVQDSQKPYATLNIRFRNEDDLQKFAEIINQKLTNKTRSVWYPPLEKRQRGLWRDDES